jgi:hypothetical protein
MTMRVTAGRQAPLHEAFLLRLGKNRLYCGPMTLDSSAAESDPG